MSFPGVTAAQLGAPTSCLLYSRAASKLPEAPSHSLVWTKSNVLIRPTVICPKSLLWVLTAWSVSLPQDGSATLPGQPGLRVSPCPGCLFYDKPPATSESHQDDGLRLLTAQVSFMNPSLCGIGHSRLLGSV